MSRILRTLIFLILMLVVSSFAYADLSITTDETVRAGGITVVQPSGVTLPSVNSDPGSAIASIIRYAILLAGVLAVMAITWGGIQYILAAGEDEKLKKAKKIIIYAFVGLVLAGLAYTIVQTIAGSTITIPSS